MSPEERAWVAAVLDMKATVVRKKNDTRKTPQVVLMVETRQIGVVRRLCELTGTESDPIRDRPSKDWMQRGCTEHCPDAHVHHEAAMPDIARWTATGAAAAIVLWNVVPYMVTDKGLTGTMNELIASMVVAGRGSGATKAAIRRLMDLGWEIPPELVRRLLAEGTGEALVIPGRSRPRQRLHMMGV